MRKRPRELQRETDRQANRRGKDCLRQVERVKKHNNNELTAFTPRPPQTVRNILPISWAGRGEGWGVGVGEGGGKQTNKQKVSGYLCQDSKEEGNGGKSIKIVTDNASKV